MPEKLSAEQQARDMLERCGVEDAQSFSAGDVVELANLIAGVTATTTDEVLAAFAALPLTMRMRAAADVLDEVDPFGVTAHAWVPVTLREHADKWEEEDRADADQRRVVEDLARHLYSVCEPPDALAWDGNIYTGHQDRWIERARDLLDRFDITPKEKP